MTHRSRRDQFVARMGTRVERMEQQLKNLTARDAQKRELEDTRVRVSKIKDDVERLGKAGPARASICERLPFERLSPSAAVRDAAAADAEAVAARITFECIVLLLTGLLRRAAPRTKQRSASARVVRQPQI
jgi:hypothetical protein